MAMKPHRFKRLVLGLQPSAPDHTLRLAVELADLLHLELLGLFLEDTSLRDLASIPFAREFRPLGGGWHTIELERLSQELELAARNIERMFTSAARHLSTRHQFEIVRGPTAQTIATISQTDDIIMIVEPVSAAERATQQFAWLIEAAFRSAAAVLLVPPNIVRARGPVVAIAATPDDASLQAAAAIALACKEELVIIEADGHPGSELRAQSLAGDMGLAIKRLAAAKFALPDPATCAQAFRQTQERLIVMSRGAFEDEAAAAIAAVRRVPVLVVEPLPAPKPAP
jgi:hypothetical protein